MIGSSGETLAIEDVRKVRQGDDGRPVEILRGVNLEVPPGRLTVVVGPSGGGKSTLLRLVNRLEDPSSGRILLSGTDIAAIDPLQLRRRIGVVLQLPFMYEGTVLDNLQRGFVFRGVPAPAAKDAGLLQILELCRLSVDLLARQARSLSIGQQQRVGLARTLLAAPGLLVLDEPTSALDRPTSDQLGRTLQEICHQHQISVLMMTHDLRLAQRVADHAAFLDEGRIVESGEAGSLFANPRSEGLKNFLTSPVDPREDGHV
ncbi:MAG: ABC transporter [Desulfuromonadaceae bacterium GWC2_58_13]|nr:MAG: ABC transporter [Desulfuromonadaceae bacterium GWC2_58_13]